MSEIENPDGHTIELDAPSNDAILKNRRFTMTLHRDPKTNKLVVLSILYPAASMRTGHSKQFRIFGQGFPWKDISAAMENRLVQVATANHMQG